MKTARLICILSLAVFGLSAFPSRAADATDAVTLKDGKMYELQGDQQVLLAGDLKFPDKISVSANGTFTVAAGRDRKLGEGQILRSDGWLLDPSGAAQPVFDHIAMKGGRVLLFRDGQVSPISQAMKFSTGLAINPDGTCTYPDGAVSRLVDGQLFRLDGTAIPAKDTVTLINGRVVVQKDGKLITLQPVQIMGMNDGTRVHGDGSIQKLDGTTTQLREGQTILIEGPLVRH